MSVFACCGFNARETVSRGRRGEAEKGEGLGSQREAVVRDGGSGVEEDCARRSQLNFLLAVAEIERQQGIAALDDQCPPLIVGVRLDGVEVERTKCGELAAEAEQVAI